ncbi:TPA: hypothetical protein ACT5CD_007390, partial [Burkholderia cenocepacia]
MMTNDHGPDAGRHSLPVIRSDPEKLDGVFAEKRKNFRRKKLWLIYFNRHAPRRSSPPRDKFGTGPRDADAQEQQ